MTLLVPGAMVLERYRVLEPLPRWYTQGMLGRDERLGQSVDLIIAPAPGGTPAGDLFVRRAQRIGSLQHAAIPVVCDVAEHDGYPLVVQRHAEGRSLSRLLQEDDGRLDVAAALRLAGDVARALCLAHDAGVQHGALDAQSIVVDTLGHGVLVDVVWPRGAENRVIGQAEWDDAAGLCRVLAALASAWRGRKCAQARLDVERLYRRCAAPRIGMPVRMHEVANAIARIATEMDIVVPAQAAVLAAQPAPRFMPSPAPARPVARGAYARRSPARRPTNPPRAWAIALVVGAALTLLPGVEAVAHEMLAPASFGPWRWHIREHVYFFAPGGPNGGPAQPGPWWGAPNDGPPPWWANGNANPGP